MGRVRGSSNRPNDNTADPTTGLVFSPDARRQVLKPRVRPEASMNTMVRKPATEADRSRRSRVRGATLSCRD
jgi:hypothetical protein